MEYDIDNPESAQHTQGALDRGIVVFLLRAVLLLARLGSIRDEDTNIRLLYHVFELSLVAILHGAVSHVLAYRRSAWLEVNKRLWIDAAAADMADAVSGWAGVVTAAVLATSMAAGQLRVGGGVPAALLMASLLDPVIVHWAWSSKGLAHDDVTKCSNLHLLSGIMASAAVAYVAVTLLRSKFKSSREFSTRSSSIGADLLGAVFLVVCMLGMCMPYAFNQMTHEFGKYMGGNVSNRMCVIWKKVNGNFPSYFNSYSLREVDIETGLVQPFRLNHVNDVSNNKLGNSEHVIISFGNTQSCFY